MKLDTKTHARLAQPADPYDTPAWLAFYEQNPGWRRSVGAEGVNDDDDTGGGDDDDDANGDDDDANDDNANDDSRAGDDNGGMSDKEAELLRDVMKSKEARKALEAEIADLKKKYGDIDIEEYRAIKKQQTEAKRKAKEAEQQRLHEAGEFDKLKEQMVSQHQDALKEVNDALSAKDEELKKAHKLIEDLTVGNDFATSKFIADGTVYTPSKARRLYGDHFEVEDGKVVGYNKPRGHEDRVKLVDASGNPASFDAAMRRIIDADPEKDDILLASLKEGANSDSGGKKKAEEKKGPASSRDKISEGLTSLMSNIDKTSDSDFKL